MAVYLGQYEGKLCVQQQNVTCIMSEMTTSLSIHFMYITYGILQPQII